MSKFVIKSSGELVTTKGERLDQTSYFEGIICGFNSWVPLTKAKKYSTRQQAVKAARAAGIIRHPSVEIERIAV